MYTSFLFDNADHVTVGTQLRMVFIEGIIPSTDVDVPPELLYGFSDGTVIFCVFFMCAEYEHTG